MPEATGTLKEWQIARAKAVADLRKVATAIAKTKDPEALSLVQILEAVVKNLPLNPDNPQAVGELAKYLETEEVILAAEQAPPEYGGPLTIRDPLVHAVKKLSQNT